MWWPRLALLGALVLAGCGFHPLYGKHAGGQSAAIQFAQVRIQPIADRTGQLLYNKLRDRFNPRGKPANPVYLLQVTLHERQERLLVETDETASRVNLILRAEYQLKQFGTDTVLDSGVSQTVISYDVLGSQFQFSTLSSEADVRDRATEQLSEDISTRIAIYFSSLIGGS
jgi:LPS-assembly lipoprotein